jgi:hypothetical protein
LATGRSRAVVGRRQYAPIVAAKKSVRARQGPHPGRRVRGSIDVSLITAGALLPVDRRADVLFSRAA